MKLNDAKREVSTEGFEDNSHIFKIKQSQRAFEILSSNIYSDKILAVVREYGCNALDAHKAVGKTDVAFNVHLPNTYEPFFTIRDFGPGLSDENVTLLFTTYFESTKDQSNDFTGCLGLGSKSAFSYVDQFSITSYFDGVKTFFSAYLNMDNVPQITLVSKEQSTEPNGLEISMAVKPADFPAFKEKAGQIFKRFPVAPNFSGASIQLETLEYALVGKTYKLLKHNGYTKAGGSVIQGCVKYPIDIQSFNIPLTDLQRAVLDYPIEMEFEIGELNITASRERLNYDKTTQQNILNKVDKVIEKIKNDINDKVSKLKSLYEARVLYANTIQSSGLLSTIIKKGFDYNGEEVETNRLMIDLTEEVPLIDPLTNQVVMDFKGNPKTKTGYWGLMAEYDYWKLSNKVPNQSSSDTKRWFDAEDLLVDGVYKPNRRTTVLVLKDIDKVSAGPILKYNFEDKGVKQVIVITLDDINRWNEVLEQLEGYPESNIFKLSELERPPKEVKTKAAKAASPTRKFLKMKYFHSDGTVTLEEQEVDSTKGGYYLMSYSGGIINDGVPLSAEYKDINNISLNKKAYIRVLAHLQDIGKRTRNHDLLDIVNNIYVINSSYKDIPMNNPKWVSAYDALKPFIDKFYNVDIDFVKLMMKVAMMEYDVERLIRGCFKSTTNTNLIKSIKTEFSGILLRLKTRGVLPSGVATDKIMEELERNTDSSIDRNPIINSTVSGALQSYKDLLLDISNYYILYNNTKVLSNDIQNELAKGTWSNIEFVPKAIQEDVLLGKLIKATQYSRGFSIEDVITLITTKYKS